MVSRLTEKTMACIIYTHFLTTPLWLVTIFQLLIFTSASFGDVTNVTIGGNTFQVCTTSLCDERKCGADVPGDPTPCHCDYACEFYNDCCGDYDHSICLGEDQAESVRRFRETVDVLKQVDLACISPNPDEEDAYWMIQSCPDTWKDSAVRYKCSLQETSSNTDLVRLPIVHGGVTYRNLFCALCNGIELKENIVGWQFQFNCPNIDTKNVTLHGLVHSENCEPRVVPPAEVTNVSLRPCLNNYISSCPNNSPPILQNGCMSFSDVCKNDSAGVFYKNPYCKLCNEGAVSQNWTIDQTNEFVARICSLPEEAIRPIEPSIIISFSFDDGIVDDEVVKDTESGPLIPISVLVDFSGNSGVSIFYSENIIVKTQVSCSGGEVFDLASERCVAVTCADGYTLFDGSCVKDSPSFNLTCGNEGDDLEISMNVFLSTEDNDTCQRIDSDQSNRITACIVAYLFLPKISIILSNQRPMESSTHGTGQNPDCTEEGYTSLDYRVNATVITYSKLEESLDKYFLDVYRPTPDCGIRKVMISQRCVAIEGLQQCPSGMIEKLSDPEFQTINGISFVYDNMTGNLYHPYETESVASYDLQDSLPVQSFHKNNMVRICDRGNILSCPLISRNATFFEPVIEKAHYLTDTNTGEILGPDEYMLAPDGSIQVCVPVGSGQNATMNDTVVKQFFRYNQSQIILSYVGVCLSLLALIIAFLTYSAFPVLRQCVSNKLIMILCVALFAAQLLQLLNGLATRDEDACMIVAVVGHFLWLLVFALTTVLAIELDRTFGSKNNLSLSSDSLKSLFKYSTFAFVSAAAIVGICLGVHFTIGEEINFQYGSETLCWIGNRTANLIAFGGPLSIFLLVNLVLFVHTVYGIRRVTKVRNRAIRHAGTLKEKGKELRIYWKISTLLGFTWLFGFVAAFAGVPALWYVFIVLNSLQGLYIFLAFMANKRVFYLWSGALSCGRRGYGRKSHGKGKGSSGKSTSLTLVAGTVSTASEHRISNQFTTWNSNVSKV